MLPVPEYVDELFMSYWRTKPAEVKLGSEAWACEMWNWLRSKSSVAETIHLDLLRSMREFYPCEN